MGCRQSPISVAIVACVSVVGAATHPAFSTRSCPAPCSVIAFFWTASAAENIWQQFDHQFSCCLVGYMVLSVLFTRCISLPKLPTCVSFFGFKFMAWLGRRDIPNLHLARFQISLQFQSIFLRNDSLIHQPKSLRIQHAVRRLPVMCSAKIVEQSKDYFSVYHSPQSGPKIEFLIAFANGQDFSYWYCNRLMACLALGAEGIFSQYVQHPQTSQRAQCNRPFLFILCDLLDTFQMESYLFRESVIWSIGDQIIVEMY